MSQYFHDVAAQKLSRREPLFFYHHPGHRHWDVVRDLCDHLRGTGARQVTLGEYAAWWNARRALRPSFRLNGDSVVTSIEGVAPGAAGSDVTVCVSWKGGEESIVPLLEGGSGKERYGVIPYVPPADITRIREFDLRGEIGRQFTRLQRRFP
jgi:hypothetical protein